MSGTELEVAHKPCVYAWVREGQILYIGMSSYGYSRPLNPNHEKIKKYTLGEHDQIYFWAYDSPTEAYENEQRAIKHFKPELNYTVNPQKKIGVCDFCKEEFDKTGKGGKRFCSNKCRFAEWDRLHPRTKPLNIGIKIVN